MGKLGAGEWTLQLEDGETIDATLDTVDVSEAHGFHAGGATRTRRCCTSSQRGYSPAARFSSVTPPRRGRVGTCRGCRRCHQTGV